MELVQTDEEIQAHMFDQETQRESEQEPLILPPEITSTVTLPRWHAGQEIEN